MNTDQKFTDKCAVNRGLKVAQSKAPLLHKFVGQGLNRAQLERVAGETAQLGHLNTAAAMKQVIREL